MNRVSEAGPRRRGPGALLLVLGVVLAGGVMLWWLSSQWDAMTWWIQSQQRDLHRQLAEALREVRNQGAPAAWALLSLSFVYGVFHAAGPGHGKAVIATYLGTQESRLKRGIVMSVLASLLQAVVAVTVVETALGLLDLGLRRTQAAGQQVETFSFAVVALLGAIFVLRALRRLWRRVQAARQQSASGAAPATGLFSSKLAAAAARDAKGDSDASGEGDASATLGSRWQQFCADCGRMHGPSRHQLEAPMSWRALAGIVVSIGIRPCTGAILVLLVAHTMDLRAVGIAAVVAMSIGTALTTSVLAVISVLARHVALRLLSTSSRTPATIGIIVEIASLCGGLFICALGLSLLHTALLLPAHPLF
ncbi:high frequency lysogenization protein HflD [Pigmentiphaga aceris]|uniref:Nickel/cobalt efflux system n=1 Tax=Pigmentiphaga aceris TaxID=1940612 RepID=A0A5C0ASC0_9BURK|nr:high frequency lysogenization protein HflD [Pigmentiphaga aceris]QEI05139.1 high frequency lysogenization protein HflD [Pigmentiphaga aceris]